MVKPSGETTGSESGNESLVSAFLSLPSGFITQMSAWPLRVLV